MTKTILVEQLPPELFNMISDMNAEIKELRRMIQEGDVGMAISEAEFNVVKEKVAKLEENVSILTQQIGALNFDPAQIEELINGMNSINNSIGTLESYDRSNATVVSSLSERLTTVETKHVTLSLRDLQLPSTTSGNLELPETDDYMSVITWSSSHPQYISQDGGVNQPPSVEGNISVVLTATAKYGSSEATKTFVVSVLAAEKSDSEKIRDIVSQLDYSIFTATEKDGAYYINSSQYLPNELEGATVTWSSSNEGVITNDGIVTLPVGNDEPVTLTAELSLGAEIDMKMFNLIVERVPEEIVDPVEPTDPTEPVDPVIPVDPDPTEPEQPTDPVEPDPVDPGVTEPTEPEPPVEPEVPVEPTEPEVTEPVEPEVTEPEIPTEPEEPEVVEPTEPEVEPTEPPVDPEVIEPETTEPEVPTEPETEPTDPEVPAEPEVIEPTTPEPDTSGETETTP